VDVIATDDTRVLDGSHVDIWMMSIPGEDDSWLTSYLHMLSEAEISRLDRFIAPAARRQYLAGRILVRTTLSRYAEVDPHEWRFEANAYGRPHIAWPRQYRELQFNLSHTDGLAACGVMTAGEIGVDVENMARDLDIADLAPSVFAANEVASLSQAPASDRIRLFYSYWTLKEAYIKARGMGLSLPLDGFWFDHDGAAARINFLPKCPDDSSRWHFREHMATQRHKLAVAVAGGESPPHVRWLWAQMPGQASDNHLLGKSRAIEASLMGRLR
jgi:4'-phosphopantetheinyl transferase